MCLDSELLPDCVKSGHLGLSATKFIFKLLNLESLAFFHFVYSKHYIYKFNLFI